MNTVPLFFALLVAALALAPRAVCAAGKPAAPAQPAPPPKSVFVIDSQVGRDPFFPKSTRLSKVPVQTTVVVTANPSQFSDEIRVQGFSNQRDKIIVIVNGKSVAKGEQIELNLRGGRVRVRCLDVTEKTIILESNGITKELPLPVITPVQP